MKRIIICFTFALMVLSAHAQTQESKNTNMHVNTERVMRFKLYPTSNMWTFLKLDTRNGKIYQVQWSTKFDSRFEVDLNPLSLVREADETDGRFALYQTTNIYNFILLDQINGRTWQVQWSQNYENRAIVPIDKL